MSFDRLQRLILERKNPSVAGLDPRLEYVPEELRSRCIGEYGATLRGAAEAVFAFNAGLLDALTDIVPAVKLQSAFYERLGVPGMDVLERTIRLARELGFYVIGDMKRGDVGSTAEAYSDAYLGSVEVEGSLWEPFPCDCLTVNAYLGSDGLRPFLKTCLERDRSVFALVKTSNPSSGELQDRALSDGPVYAAVGRLLEELGAGAEGEFGFTPLGAVAGATHPTQLADIRETLKRTFLLVPGYGAQGGRAEDVACAFIEGGLGAVVNSSRGIICAWQKNGGDYRTAARDAAAAMREDLARFIKM
ncbi:MAG: orotidine-5'-phosphate decarboxylase [Oscillospiraceae bacterium]|nr:orotidine-5'-phosphate decarboxylase [Oscillospiraceae bacterium]